MARKRHDEEIVIYCPGKKHAEALLRVTCRTCGKPIVWPDNGPEEMRCRTCRQTVRKADGESQPATPKILLVAKPGSVGRFKVQCNSNRCKHSQGSEYNGWYEIDLGAVGTYTIKALPRQHFRLRTAPAVVLAGE